MANPIIQSFDLSSDGKSVALLVVAGTKVGASLWLVTEDIATKQMTASLDLGPSVFPGNGFAPQVLYSSDRRYLIIQDLQQIRVFDSGSLKLVRTVEKPSAQPGGKPLFILGASSSNVFVCAFGSQEQPEYIFHRTPAQLTVVDVSSGKVLGGWVSNDVPQAISATGELIAVSSSQARNGLLPLDVFDTKGHQITELDGGFSFRRVSDQAKALGRVRGLFIGDQEILLTPDENVDPTGHHSGDTLRIVSVMDGHIQQAIKPQHYGPTGELASSKDHKTILVTSWYLPAGAYRNEEKPLPPSSAPEVLLYRQGGNLQLDATLPIHGLGLKVSGWLENRRPRASADGSVIAVAQDSGVSVLTKNP